MAIGIGNAKTILLGEHFVVYGCKAIGFGIDKEIEVEIKKAAKFEIGFTANEKFLTAIEVLKKLLKLKDFKIDIKKSGIPVASGLGSGAALNVAIARALSKEFGLGLTDKQVCDLVFETEKVFHDTPSGIDNTLATYGGTIVFQKRPKGNLIERLKIGSPLHLVLANSGIKSETKAMVDKVREFKGENETIFSELLKIETRIVEQAIPLIKNGNHEKLGQLMNINHGLLNTISASHIENEKIVAIARENGALGAKLVGAGGGGFCAALMENQESALKLVEIISKQYWCFYNLVPAN